MLYFLIASAAKDILLDCVLENPRWGLLDLYALLTEDIVKFDVRIRLTTYCTENHQTSKAIHSGHPDLLLKLLRKKCSVSDCVE